MKYYYELWMNNSRIQLKINISLSIKKIKILPVENTNKIHLPVFHMNLYTHYFIYLF